MNTKYYKDVPAYMSKSAAEYNLMRSFTFSKRLIELMELINIYSGIDDPMLIAWAHESASTPRSETKKQHGRAFR